MKYDTASSSRHISNSAQSMAVDLLQFVNSLTHDNEVFAKQIAQAHKTLQQSTMRLFVTTIAAMAEVEPDERNKQTVELAKRITEIAKDYTLPLI